MNGAEVTLEHPAEEPRLHHNARPRGRAATGVGKPGSKLKAIAVYMPPEMMDRINAYAAQEQVSFTAAARQLLEWGLIVLDQYQQAMKEETRDASDTSEEETEAEDIPGDIDGY